MHRHYKERLSPHIIITSAILFVGILEAVGTTFYMLVEKWSFVDSLYFTTITLTTIGFGDLVPTQPHAKLFTSFFAFAGVGTVLFYVTLVADNYFHHKMGQLAKLEHKIHKMLTPEEIKREEEEIREDRADLEAREKRLLREKAQIQHDEEEVEQEEKEVEQKKKKIRSLVKKI